MNPAEFDAWLVAFITSCKADLPDASEWIVISGPEW